MLSLEFEELRKGLGSEQISQNVEDLLKYGNDWLKQWPGRAHLVLFPKKTEDLVFIVNWARRYRYKLIPSGGRTGLSGGATALNKELVVSFDKMNRILDFSSLDQTICVEAGCVTKNLQELARSRGLYFPVSFASEGSSQIGGNIATNVGGVNVLRYGTIKNRVLGLEVVTGSGEVLNLGKGLVKNAAGYHLQDIIIGSEGTLAFITQAVLSLVPFPDDPQVFLMAVENPKDLFTLFKEFRDKTQPLAFEFWTDKALDYVLSHGEVDFPFSKRSPLYVLFEVEKRDQEIAFQIFEKAFKEETVRDGVLSQSSLQGENLWKLRENISESIAQFHPYKNDISVRIGNLPDFMNELTLFLKQSYPDFESVIFGHLGDGNLHINILKPEGWDREDFIKQCEKSNEDLFKLVQKYEGSVSAEHGVGLLKKPYLKYSCSDEEIALMKNIKRVFDPDNILNPGKIFDLQNTNLI